MAVVVLQRGHVPRTSGATGAPGEQQYAIACADRCAPALRRIGHDARVIDADPTSDAAYRGDIFFALHWDSSTNPTASGASVGYQTPEGQDLAQQWKRQYKNAGWTRAFKPDNYTAALGGYYGVRKAVGQGNRLAIITEAGFVSNSHDKAMMSPELTALSIVNTVAEIFGEREGENLPDHGGSMLFLVRGHLTNGVYITNLDWKFHMRTPDESKFFLWTIRSNGGSIAADPNNGPLVWDQADVDNFRLTSRN